MPYRSGTLIGCERETRVFRVVSKERVQVYPVMTSSIGLPEQMVCTKLAPILSRSVWNIKARKGPWGGRVHGALTKFGAFKAPELKTGNRPRAKLVMTKPAEDYLRCCGVN